MSTQSFPPGLIDEILDQLSNPFRHHLFTALHQAQGSHVNRVKQSNGGFEDQSVDFNSVKEWVLPNITTFVLSFSRYNTFGHQRSAAQFSLFPGILSSLPNLTHLNLDRQHEKDLIPLLFSPPMQFPKLESLNLSLCHITPADLEYLSQSPNSPQLFPSLEILLFNHAHSCGSEQGMESLLKLTAKMPRLNHLDLRGVRIDSRAITRHLSRSPLLSQLKVLILGGANLDGKALVALLHSPHFSANSNLTHLDLSSCLFNGEGDEHPCPFDSLTNNRRLSNLTVLKLNDCNVDSDCISLLLKSKTFAKLTALDLGSNHGVNDEALEMLSNSPHMANLTYLSVELCEYATTKGINSLAKSPSITKLTHLNLSHVDLSCKPKSTLVFMLLGLWGGGLAAPAPKPAVLNLDALLGDFFLSPNLANLTSLDISCTSIPLSGLISMAQSPHLGNLTELNVSSDRATDSEQWTKIFFNSPHFAKVTTLNLSNCDFGETVITHLIQSPYMSNLATLDLSMNDDINTTQCETALREASTTTLPRLDELKCAPKPLVIRY